MNNDYFCIFAGGGVRGTAYLGVLKVLQEQKINMSGMAGSSVGAIFASLCAVGYSFDELKDIIFNINYKTFKDLYFPMGKDFGFCKGDNLYYWLKDILEKKFYEKNFSNSQNRPVTFKDLDKDLIIIATNVSKKNYKEYSKRKTPNIEVAHAVRASISVPGFFKPVWEDEDCLVDGDVIKNFPLWAFSDNILPDDSRVLEFRLESTQTICDIRTPFDYFNAILDTSYKISTNILINEYGMNDQFDIIRIDTGNTQIIDFNISNEQKEQLIENGAASTLTYFTQNLAQKRKKILNKYIKLQKNINQLFFEVEKNKITESLISIGELSLLLADNKLFISKKIYEQISDLKSLYQDKLSCISPFRIRFIKNKKALLQKIAEVNDLLEAQIKGLAV